MLAHKTLLIVGAGASADFKLPLGPDLAGRIAEIMPRSMRFDNSEFASELDSVVCDSAPKLNQAYQAALHIKRNLPLSASIDSYLDSHRENEWRVKVAKMAIAFLIGEAESNSALQLRADADAYNFDFAQVQNTWLKELWTVLHLGRLPSERSRIFENLSVATFNYDRCIEQFLRLALCNFFDCPIADATQIVANLQVLHVYGSLGELTPVITDSAAFNPDFSTDIEQASASIKTFTEPVSDAGQELAQLIIEAEQIVFVGFSFGLPNLNLIEDALPQTELQRRIFGTIYLMDPDRVEAAQEWLYRLFGRRDPLQLRNCRGSELIHKFSARW